MWFLFFHDKILAERTRLYNLKQYKILRDKEAEPMAALHFEIGKEYTLTKTFAESDVYLFAGIIGDLFPAHVN